MVSMLASINVVNRHWAAYYLRGDCLWTGKQSGYVTSRLGQLSLLPSVG